MNRHNLTGLTVDEIRSFTASLGERPYRGDQLFGWIHQKHAATFDEMTDLPKGFREQLGTSACVRSMAVHARSVSRDGTTKFALRLEDGAIVESVLIPSGDDGGRLTLCLSTQVGCPLDCAFCATGTMGFTRNLTVGEIVEQYLIAQAGSDVRISNIVYMGMGEPMLNYANVMRSIDILTDARGAGIGVRHITVSTAGYADKIRLMADEDRKVRLALSLHSLDERVRTQIMPLTKKYGIEELTDALLYYFDRVRRRPTLEYVLFDGLNDTDEDVKRLVTFTRRVPSKVNIIPFHSIAFTHPGGVGSSLRPTPRPRLERFAELLRGNGVIVMVRSSSGEDINAACGQLAARTGRTPAATEHLSS